MAKRLTRFRVLTFDCYGTLIDWEQGIANALEPLFRRNGAGRRDPAGSDPASGTDRAAALRAFARFEGRHERENPGLRYPDLLQRVHHDLAGSLGLETTPALDTAFGASVPRWPAFPDSAEALRVLKRHFRLVILSNVHREGIAASIERLGVGFDAVYTAEEIGSYKPADANFAYLLERLRRDFGFGRSDVLHTAQSLHHDHVPANRFGLASAWIDRQRQSEGGSSAATAPVREMPRLDFVFFSLAEMAAAALAERDQTRRPDPTTRPHRR